MFRQNPLPVRHDCIFSRRKMKLTARESACHNLPKVGEYPSFTQQNKLYIAHVGHVIDYLVIINTLINTPVSKL